MVVISYGGRIAPVERERFADTDDNQQSASSAVGGASALGAVIDA